MSLQGSLDSFSLVDVLSLLARTEKTGELDVRGPKGGGRLWLDAGQLIGADPGSSAADGVFRMLLVDEGEFAFCPGERPRRAGSPSDVDAAVAEASVRLAEWREIEAVVPSVDAGVALAADAAGTVTLSPAQWRAVVSIAASGSVRGVADGLGSDEFDACRVVKELVEAGLVSVSTSVAMPELDTNAPVSLPARRRRTRPAPAPALAPDAAEALVRELAELGTDPTEAAEAIQAAAEAPTEEARVAAIENVLPADQDEPINRGLLLKFLSSVRS